MPTSSEPPVSGTADVRVYLNGTQVPTMAQHSVVVEMDINQPDMCTATLRNGPTDGYSKNNKMGDEIEIKIIPVGATDQVSIFKGDIVGIEPSWDVKGESKVIFRALNKLHRMGHTKVSKSYMSMSDKDMANAVAQECGLTLNTGTNPPDSTVWPHTYRHHQTALEFLQDRGGRFNYEFRVSDTTLYYSKRDLTTDSGIQCQFGYQAPAGDPPTIVTLQKFTARIINQSQVGTMKVFGYDPAQAKAVVASVDATVVLGSKGGHQHAADGLGAAPIHVDSDIPVGDSTEATAVATAKIAEMSLNFVKAEALCQGDPRLKPSIVVTIGPVPGAQEPDTRFSGKYYVVSCTHRYGHKSSGDGGYHVLLKLKRDATNG